MSHCPRCERISDGSVPCPECDPAADSALIGDDGIRFVRIARFTHAAEAGYFAHELAVHTSIATRIIAEEDFDALSGYWSTRYALAVKESISDAARAAIREIIDSLDSDEYDDERTETPDVVRDASGVNWIPVVLTLAAGSMAFWAARRIQDQPKPAVMAAPAARQSKELWDYIADDPQPWVQQFNNGGGQRELHCDRQRRLIVVREDRDGDGRFESESTFPLRSLQH